MPGLRYCGSKIVVESRRGVASGECLRRRQRDLPKGGVNSITRREKRRVQPIQLLSCALQQSYKLDALASHIYLAAFRPRIRETRCSAELHLGAHGMSILQKPSNFST